MFLTRSKWLFCAHDVLIMFTSFAKNNHIYVRVRKIAVMGRSLNLSVSIDLVKSFYWIRHVRLIEIFLWLFASEIERLRSNFLRPSNSSILHFNAVTTWLDHFKLRNVRQTETRHVHLKKMMGYSARFFCPLISQFS